MPMRTNAGHARLVCRAQQSNAQPQNRKSTETASLMPFATRLMLPHSGGGYTMLDYPRGGGHDSRMTLYGANQGRPFFETADAQGDRDPRTGISAPTIYSPTHLPIQSPSLPIDRSPTHWATQTAYWWCVNVQWLEVATRCPSRWRCAYGS